MEKVLQHLLVIVTLWFCSVPCEQVARSCGRERFLSGLGKRNAALRKGQYHPRGVTKVKIILCTTLRGGGRFSSKQCCPF